MADVAFIFGWLPDAMAPMLPAELMRWRTKAVARHNPED